jgi:hypothetical protein
MTRAAVIAFVALVAGGGLGWWWALATLCAWPAGQLARAFYDEFVKGPAFELHPNDLPNAPPARFTLDDMPAWVGPVLASDIAALTIGEQIRTQYRTIRRVR